MISHRKYMIVHKRYMINHRKSTIVHKRFMIYRKKSIIYQNPAPMLVPIIEEGNNKLIKPLLAKYLKPFMDKELDALVLGCTHYPIIKKEIKEYMPKKIKIISQDEIIPKKLKEYLQRHQEITKKLSRNESMKILVTDKNQNMDYLVKKWFGKNKVTTISQLF